MFDRRQPERWKHQVRASFDTTDPSYGRPGDYHWAFAERLVAHAPLQPAQRVLDVATGTAPAAILAAHKVGSVGYVVGTDLSPGILILAKQHLAAARVGNVAVYASDAEDLAVRDRSVDGVLCSLSIVARYYQVVVGNTANSVAGNTAQFLGVSSVVVRRDPVRGVLRCDQARGRPPLPPS